MSNTSKPFIKYLPVILLMALVLFMSATNGDIVNHAYKQFARPIQNWLYFTGFLSFLTLFDWYKAFHFLVYGLLGSIVYRILLGLTQHPFTKAVVIIFIFACLDELLQSFVPGRHASLSDILLDTLSAIFGILMTKYLTKGKFAIG